MLITMIAALDRNRVIGCRGRLPWDLPADRAFFRERVRGHAVVVGRKTYRGLPRSVLAGCWPVVVAHQYPAGLDPQRASWEPNVLRALLTAAYQTGLRFADSGHQEIFVIGGAQVYRQALPYAGKLILTRVHGEFLGDARFPPIDSSEWHCDWLQSRFHYSDADNPYGRTVETLWRRR